MLIDALIVDRYEIKKFKLWNNIKKKNKKKLCRRNPAVQHWTFQWSWSQWSLTRKVHGTVVWQDAVELGLNVKET